MKKILGFETANQVLGEFRFSEFRIVREVHFYEVPDESRRRQNIDLVVESEDRHPNYRMQFTFCDVSGLRIDGFGGGETRIIGLDIVNIAEKQWEGISWEIIDFENNAIEFRANTAEIISVL